jgi:phosphate starvation-inducible membrane PsiE
MSNTTLLLPSANKSAELNNLTMSSGSTQSAYFKLESQILKELLLLTLAMTYLYIVFFFINRTFILVNCKVNQKTSQKVKYFDFNNF